MAHAAAMNPKIFRVLREFGMEEKYATRIAEAILPAERIATKEDVADLRADIPERGSAAAKSDVAVLQSEMTDVKSAIVRIDKSIVRIDKSIARIDESVARLDERSKDDRVVTRFIVLPLMLLMQATLFGILSKGILWAVAP